MLAGGEQSRWGSMDAALLRDPDTAITLTLHTSSLPLCCLWTLSHASSSNLHSAVGTCPPSPCPLVISPTLLFQRTSAKATSQCSVGWKSCLAIAPSPATTSSAASPATHPETSATQRTEVWNLHPGSTMTSMCLCPHSRGPL